MIKLNTIQNIDCLEGMKQIEDNSIHLTVTDPPYAQEYEYLWEPLAKQLQRVMVDGGSIITLCGHYQVPFVINTLSKYFQYWWIGGIVQKRSNRLAGKWVMVKWKPALWFVKGKKRTIDFQCPFDLVYPQSKDWDTKYFHEWGQPIEFSENWIKYLTVEKDTVLDPFMGSGTTAIACKRLKRNYIGFELDKNKFNKSLEQIALTQIKSNFGGLYK